MVIKQLSVFLENKAGRLSGIIGLLAKANIDIRAISVADTTEFGILRLIVNDPGRACEYLKAEGVTVSLTDVIAVGMKDTPGEFAKVTGALSDNDISIEYVYAFKSGDFGKAYVILKVDDPDRAAEVLTKNKVGMLSQTEISKM